jgi:hypothetical protein
MQRVRCFSGMRSHICLRLIICATTSLHRHAVASEIFREPAGRKSVSLQLLQRLHRDPLL